MAHAARYLIDTSAEARMRHERVRVPVQEVIYAGLAATCAALDAETLYSARSPAEYELLRSRRRSSYECLPTEDVHWQGALDAQRQLARTGRHRSVGMADLLIGVLARQHELVVLHYDADFETAAEVIGFRQQWVAPRGSLP